MVDMRRSEARTTGVRPLMYLSPLHDYHDLGIPLAGTGAARLWRPIVALLVLGGATLGFGI
jgi:hypothetical protein